MPALIAVEERTDAADGASCERSGVDHGVWPQVIEGQADRVAACGIDRWLGGVHLEGRGPMWRWDSASNRLANR